MNTRSEVKKSPSGVAAGGEGDGREWVQSRYAQNAESRLLFARLFCDLGCGYTVHDVCDLHSV